MTPGRRTFGADEAGRGPILGPMAISVVCLDRGAAISLKKRGISDSKEFGAGPDARARREALAEIIRERACSWRVRLVEVDEIDRHVFQGLLNALERRVVHELLDELQAERDDRIFCDGAVMFSPLRAHFPKLRAVNNGEAAHVSVAAASILAKVTRDAAFATIAARYDADFGPVAGGGYLNAGTRRFLDAYAERYGKLPPEARKSWGAAKRAANLDLFGTEAATCP